MPEEIEVPTEQLHEALHEEAHKGGHEEGPSWVARAALSAALIAVLAAVSALLAGHHANEAMLEQMKATDQWAYYQAKGIKANVLETKVELLGAMGKEVKPEERARIEEYKKQQKEIEDKGKELEASSEGHMKLHSMLARTVTIFQVAIAMAAISVLSKKKLLWFVSLFFGLAGAVMMALAFV